MDANNILKASLLDLLFENRNKNYGAYELRKNYNKRLATALSILFLFLGICWLVTRIHRPLQTKSSAILTEDFKITALPATVSKPLPKVPKPADHPFKKINKNPVRLQVKSFTPPKIVDDAVFQTARQIKRADELINTHIAAFEQDGMQGNIIAPAIQTNSDNGSGFGKLTAQAGNGTADGEKAEKDIPFKTVQQEAQYPSGRTGWVNYLKRNLRSDVASENGAPVGNYSVIVSFIVDREGNVSNVQADNDPGYGTAAEAVRVIKKSGKWIPAMQNGQKVIYRQKQQITFQITGE